MQTQELHEPAGLQSLLDRPVDSEGAGPVFGRITRFTRTLNVVKKAVPAALLAVLVAGAFSAIVPAVPAYASPTTLTLTAYPQNSTGVPMVVEAITNHVLRGTPDVINSPRGTVPYTSNAIVSAKEVVAVIRQPITCHGTTCT
jgi:hypothetical protein